MEQGTKRKFKMSAPMPDFADPSTPVGSASVDASTSPDTPVEPPAETSSQESGVSADNPAWSPIFEKLPDEFHGMLKPEFEKWDQGYRSLEQERNKYRDRYQPFEDIPAENLAAAYNLYQTLNTPDGQKQIYEALGEHLGVTPAQAQQIVEQQEAEPEGDPGDNPWEQQYNGLKQQFDQMQQMFQQIQHKEEVDKQGAIIDARVQTLMKEDPTLDPIQLLNWADMLHARGATGDLIGQAHAEMKKYNQQIVDRYNQQQQRRATGPITMPPSGGNPGSGVDPATRDEEARREAAAARFKALLES